MLKIVFFKFILTYSFETFKDFLTEIIGERCAYLIFIKKLKQTN